MDILNGLNLNLYYAENRATSETKYKISFTLVI